MPLKVATGPAVHKMEISSNPPEGRETYGIGDAIEATVTFSEVVNVTRTPQLGLRVGSLTRSASYAGGTGTTALEFSYTVAIESAATLDTDPQLSEFAQRVERESQRRRFGAAPRQVVLGDGAKWIWNLAGELFPEAVQIVDRFHAKERLHTLSKSLYADRQSGQEWARQRCGELDAGWIETLLSVLATEASHHEEGKAACTCFHENRHRMRYAQFEGQGLCISTSVVEAGCKNAIGARLKRSGMHWSVRGANSIMALRSVRLSGRFEDFWEWRADSNAAA